MDLPEEVHRDLAKQANARVWQLLDEPARSPEIDAELVEAAYASLYHRRFAGKDEIARRYQIMAQEAGAAISEAEDKRIFMADFETGEWYGISSGRDGSG